MTFIDRFTETGFEAAQASLNRRLQILERRIEAVPQDEIVDANWEDEELAEEFGIKINPNWVTVSDPRGITEGRFQIAAVVSENFNEDGIAYGRSLVLIGRQLGSEQKDSFRRIGKLHTAHYDGDPQMLTMQVRQDSGEHYVPWESADAAIFLKLVEQLLPEVQDEAPLDDFGG